MSEGLAHQLERRVADIEARDGERKIRAGIDHATEWWAISFVNGERKIRAGIDHATEWLDEIGTTVGLTDGYNTLILKVGTTGFADEAVCLEVILDRCARDEGIDHPAESVASMRLGSAQVEALRDLLGHAAESIPSYSIKAKE
jgi:hypothetical protein